MNLREIYFEAIAQTGVSAKEISRRSSVHETQISRFRKGGDISFENFQKLVAGLPPRAFAKFHSLLNPSGRSNEEIAEQMILLAEQFKSNVEKQPQSREREKVTL